MVRSFTPASIQNETLQDLLKLGLKAPTAGNSSAVSFLAIEDSKSLKEFWNISLPAPKRENFPWPNLLLAPVVVVVLTEPEIYFRRYEESDKKLNPNQMAGRNPKEWKVPFWHVDAGFAIQNLLLATHAQGLGALFFGIFSSEQKIKTHFQIPDSVEIVGAIALGHIDKKTQRPSKSVSRVKSKPEDMLHFNIYSA